MLSNIVKNYKNLCLKSGSLQSRWYIEYYFKDINGKWKQVKKYGGINSLKTIKDRKEEGGRILQEIQKELEAGLHLKGDTAKVNRPTLKDAIASFMSNRNEYVRPKTLELYKSIFERHLLPYCELHGLSERLIPHITSSDIKTFLEYRNNNTKKGVKLSKGSYNNYIMAFRALFSFCLSRKFLFENPMLDTTLLAKRKNNVGRVTMFKADHAEQIVNWLKVNDPVTLLFIRIIYYCAIRPEEIRRLQVYNLKFNQQTQEGDIYHEIFIEASKSKNNNNDSVMMPQVLFDYFNTLDIDNIPTHNYLFSPDGLLGEHPVSKNYFYYPFDKCLKALNLVGFGYTPYLFKHKSNVDAYLNGADLYSIMIRNRHSSLKQTEHYLKSLGIKLKRIELPLMNL